MTAPPDRAADAERLAEIDTLIAERSAYGRAQFIDAAMDLRSMIARLQQERDDWEAVAMRREADWRKVQAALAKVIDERDTATREAEALRAARDFWEQHYNIALTAHDGLLHETEALREEIGRLRGAVDFAHGWIAGLPREPSFEDKRAAQSALESVGALWSRSHGEAPDQPSADDDVPCNWIGGNDGSWCTTCGAEHGQKEPQPPCPRKPSADDLERARELAPWNSPEAIAAALTAARAQGIAQGRAGMREAVIAYHERMRTECWDAALENGIAGAHSAAHGESIDAIRALPDGTPTGQGADK